jgi:hypothetical protein
VVGGTAGQALTKIDGTDYNTQWTTIPLLTTANTFTGGVQQITTASASTKGLIVKGTASQTANLQEWQDSTGAVLANMTTTAIVLQTNSTTSERGLLIRQSNTGQQAAAAGFQKSRGTNASPSVVAVNDIAAAFVFNSYNGSAYTTDNSLFGGSITGVSGSSISTSLYFIPGTGNSNYTPAFITWHDRRVGMGAGVGDILGGLVQPGAQLQVSTTAAATKGLIVKGFASQTANLQEWQNSAATILTSITSAGTINFASGNTSATATGGAVTAPALVTGFITMQIAGTTVKVPYYSN